VPVTPTVAVTVAVIEVDKTVWAAPVASAFTVAALRDPADVVKFTGTDERGEPFTSRTLAVITDVPPIAGIIPGFAARLTWPTAAAPIAILTALAVVTLAPPDDAVMLAVPLVVPAWKVTVVRPLMSVSASGG
jgi:hypothetical protein